MISTRLVELVIDTVVCLTLAKWETVSGQFGGYLTGLVASLARPGGNATGFSSFDYNIGGKWLEFLKQIAPNVTRVAILRDPDIPAGIGQFGAVQTAAGYVGVDLHPIHPRDSGEIEQAIASFRRQPGGGLIVTQNTSVLSRRKLIIALAASHRLPAVYASRVFTMDGGLLSFGPNLLDNYRRAAAYVDRILRGEKPADMPVQAPTTYELVINLKPAKALGLTVPAPCSPASTRRSNSENVGLWHLCDITRRHRHVRLRGVKRSSDKPRLRSESDLDRKSWEASTLKLPT